MTAVAVVTGASRGIGRAVALEAAGQGYDVLLGCAVAPERAEETAAIIAGMGRKARVCAADLTTLQGVLDTVTAGRSLGPVSLLVNNAGVTSSSPLEELEMSRWQEALALNLTAPAWLAKELADDLCRNRGAIVNVGSTGGIVGSVHSLAYGASKAGLIGLTKTLARMLAPSVRVNLVAPGITETDLLGGITDEQKEEIVAGQSIPRLGSPEEIAKVILDVTRWTYCTGQTIVVDGGRAM